MAELINLHCWLCKRFTDHYIREAGTHKEHYQCKTCGATTGKEPKRRKK